MKTSGKGRRFFFLAFSLSVSFIACLPIKEAPAKTIIDANITPCEIHITLNKEFHAKMSPSLVRWINSLNDRINQLQERLNNATTDAQRDQARKDLNYFTAQRQSLTDSVMFNPPLTIDELRRLAAGWKAQIENKWNIPNYRYDCCKIVVEVNISVREEAGPPTPGFDQIGVVSGEFRSFIKGLRGFDRNGFSNSPYREDLSGVWSSNLIEGYTAPHEAGHEMGLDDKYEDPVDGGPSRPLPGHENDLLGGNGTHEQLRNLKVVVVSDTGEVIVDNLKTILRGRFARCQRECCGPPGTLRGGVRPETRELTIDTSRRAHEEGESASASSEPAPRITDTQQPGPSVETTPAADKASSAKTDASVPGKPVDTIQYKQIKVNDVTSDTGVLIKDTAAGGTEVGISSLPTGKGSNFRKWKVDKIALDLDGERLKPVKCDNFYVTKESIFKGAATAVFVALGAQYTGKAESGEVCPVTGERKAGSDVKEGGVSEGINRAGMAAGLGLLTSQAKGQITGSKCTFELNKEQSKKLRDKKGEVKIDLINEDANLKEAIHSPL